MTRYGQQFGPDFTFLDVPMCDLDDPASYAEAHHDDECWPCGDYPTQSAYDDGMTRWIADDEPLENTDLVLWYVFGIHHVTLVEDWPIMPGLTGRPVRLRGTRTGGGAGSRTW